MKSHQQWAQHQTLRCLADRSKWDTPWNLSALWAPFCSCWFLSPFFAVKTPSGSLYPNIRMAYEYTRSLTGVVLFSRIPLGVQKTLLHGGGVTSCGTYSHQSVHKQCRPLRVLQTYCVGAAGGLGLAACFRLQESKSLFVILILSKIVSLPPFWFPLCIFSLSW